MFEVQSYLRVNEEFVSITQSTFSPEDPDYIEGAIAISVGNKILLSLEEWDYIDQLWGYFITGLAQLQAGNNFETYFPDQPLKVAFKLDLKSNQVMIEVGNDKKARVDRHEFFETMLREAKFFLRS